MRGFAITAATVLSMLMLGGAPTTKPAKAPIPSSWLTKSNNTYHFHYRFPPQWVAAQQSDTTTVFKIGPATKVPPAHFVILVAPCHESTTEADAAELRKSIATDNPKAKIIKDQATTLGDKPAWLIAYDNPQTMTITRRSGNGPPQTTQVQIPWMFYQVSYVDGNLHYIVTFDGGAAPYAANLSAAQQVIDSFAWNPPSAEK